MYLILLFYTHTKNLAIAYNFFRPVIKLISKARIGTHIHRKYDIPKTFHQRIMESNKVSEKEKQELQEIYNSLNPAQLKRAIDKKLDLLCKA